MKEEKDKLRNQLFEKYFENSDGVVLTDLVIAIEPIVQAWQQLYEKLLDNCDDFDMFSRVEEVKLICRNNCNYLVIKTNIWDYMVIDCNAKSCLIKDDIINKLDENFFCENFNEEKSKSDNQFYQLYYFYSYNGNIDELIDLYSENEAIFNSENKIVYKILDGDAYTYLNINLTTGKIYLDFETPDQFLYEQLWINPDLTPSRMQDATSRIGKDKMNEMFNRIKDAKIPYDVLPAIVSDNLEIKKKSLKRGDINNA